MWIWLKNQSFYWNTLRTKIKGISPPFFSTLIKYFTSNINIPFFYAHIERTTMNEEKFWTGLLLVHSHCIKTYCLITNCICRIFRRITFSSALRASTIWNYSFLISRVWAVLHASQRNLHEIFSTEIK